MQNYKTVEERAAEWNISTRHIQYLCRMGKVEGAMKRGGVWFIPEDTPIPAKNTKSDAKSFMFVGTRKRIFDSAVNLFMLKGFNNVRLRDIAGSVGIRQSTIYNHFKSKQEILDTIYDYYCYYFLKDRPSLEDMELKLQNESLMDIIMSIRYEFKEDYLENISDITKIIFQRVGIDDRANDIVRSLMVEEGISYVETIFDKAVKMGRFAEVDAHDMAVFISSVRIFTLFIWITDPSPESLAKMAEDEMVLYEYAAGTVKDLKPPAANE